MAMVYHTEAPSVAQAPAQDHSDLVRRYCPGLVSHTPAQIAHYIPGDSTTCWPWVRSQDLDGYGIVQTVRTPYGYARPLHVHRYMYDCLVGEVHHESYVHHRCQHPPCWNPFHLVELSPKEHHAAHAALRQHQKRPWQPPEQLAFPL
jgi:hypothetical protein